ncbi:MAG: response regulator [Gammaproteobacteria bacterium]|nr:response regulator [Gammaproteobacteria bacterium]
MLTLSKPPQMPSMKNDTRYFPLKYTVTSTFLLLIIIVLAAVILFAFNDAKRDMQETYLQQQRQTQASIIKVIEVAEAGYRLLENFYDKEMREGFTKFTSAYEACGGKPACMDLETLKQELGGKMDLYIINAGGVVEYATYATDIGMDFKQYPEFYRRLNLMRKSNKFVNDGLKTEARTGKFRMYAFMPTPDNRYLLEFGLIHEAFEDVLGDLDITLITQRLKALTPSLLSIRIFGPNGNLLGDPDYKAEASVQAIIRDVYRKKGRHQIHNEASGRDIHYICTNLAARNAFSDRNKVIELTYSTWLIKESLDRKSAIYFIISSIAVSVVVLCTFWLAGWITGPIKRIVKSINVIAQGNLNHPIHEVVARNELKILKQSIIIMVRNMRQNIERIRAVNDAYEHFVPKQFLSLLEKRSITDICLGQHVEKEMSILFCDIRDFTAMSEGMTPQDNFSFINAYLSRMDPIIAEHRGFVDKYIGDAIMALFPGGADDAVKAGIAMLQRLAEYNKSRQRPGRPPLEIGIGINTGILMLGTVGGQERMDSTVISDAVNLTSRIENLTKNYGTSLLITEHTYRKLKKVSDYHIRVTDHVTVKGKTEEVTIYEVFDADSEASISLKQDTLEDFQRGFHCFHDGQFEEAVGFFEKVQAANAQDSVARIYLDNSRHAWRMTTRETPSILIVDDVPANISIISGNLHELGFIIYAAQNGEKALEIVRRQKPHLILLDIVMPGIDGFEVCKRLKENEKTCNIPVIFMTALADLDNKVKGLALGAVDYITKPFQPEEVLARINTHLTIRHLYRQLQHRNTELEINNLNLKQKIKDSINIGGLAKQV